VSYIPNVERAFRDFRVDSEVVVNHLEHPLGSLGVTEFEHDLPSARRRHAVDSFKPKPVIAPLELSKSMLGCVPVVECLKQAAKALVIREIPVACIFVSFLENPKGEIVAAAHNMTSMTKNPTLHCEINCLAQMEAKFPISETRNQHLDKIVAYVTIEPCIMCGFALNLSGIKWVIYGAQNGKFGGVTNNYQANKIPPHGYLVHGGILSEECMDIVKDMYKCGNQNIPEEKRHRRSKEK